MLKSFLFGVVFVTSIATSLHAEDTSTLDTATQAALAQLKEVTDQEAGAQATLAQATADKVAAEAALNAAKAADDAAKARLEKAIDEYTLVVTEDPLKPSLVPGYTGNGSQLVVAQKALEDAADAVRKAQQITATHPKDTELTAKLAQAQGEWTKISKKVGILKARLKRDFAPKFNEPTIATEDEIIATILGDLLKAAREKKVQTAATLAEKTLAKAAADKAAADADAALKVLQATRDRILQNEVLRKGFGAMQERIGSLEQTTATGFASVSRNIAEVADAVEESGQEVAEAVEESGQEVAEAVEEVADQVEEVAEASRAVVKTLERVNDSLIKIDGRLVSIEKSQEAFRELFDERTAALLCKISMCGLNEEDSAKLSTILERVTTDVENAEERDAALAEAARKIEKLTALVEALSSKTTNTEQYVQFLDPCSRRWYTVTAVTKSK